MSPQEELAHLQLAVQISGVDVRAVELPREHDVLLGGMRLHYLDWGTRGRLPILFLHGGALTAHTWDVVCAAMRDEYHCLALDQRGHGDSEWSPTMDYGPDAHRGDIERFVDALGLERFILVGQSLGGLNGFVYAQHHAERLAALVVIDTGAGIRIEGAQRIGDFVAETKELDSLDEFVERAVAFNPQRDPRLLRRSLRHNLRRLPNGKWVRKHDTRHLTQTHVRDLAHRATERFRDTMRVSCPTLIVRGALSDVFLDGDAERFAAALPHGRWTRIAAAGHTVQGDNARGLVQALHRFFADVNVSP